MTGAELRHIMKIRRIKTVEAAHALGIHPQTIRNLWVKDEVPRIYLMALTSYIWALGMESPLGLNPNPKGVGMDPVMMKLSAPPALAKAMQSTKKVLQVYAKDRNPQVAKEAQVVLGSDLWSKLK